MGLKEELDKVEGRYKYGGGLPLEVKVASEVVNYLVAKEYADVPYANSLILYSKLLEAARDYLVRMQDGR